MGVERFEKELELIHSPVLRDRTVAVLKALPEWWWSVRASRQMANHPPDDNVDGGLANHSAKVAWTSYKMFEAYEIETDVGVIAGLLHDCGSYGFDRDAPNASYDVYRDHAFLGADWLMQQYPVPENWDDAWGRREDQEYRQWSMICDCVRNHMGRYGSQPVNISERPVWERLVHLADLAVSNPMLVAMEWYDPENSPSLMEVSGGVVYQLAGVWIWNRGKYKGRSVEEIVAKDRGYARWIVGEKSSFDQDVKDLVREALGRGRQKRVAAAVGGEQSEDSDRGDENQPQLFAED